MHLRRLEWDFLKFVSFLFVAGGLTKVLFQAFQYPSGPYPDWIVLASLGIGMFYVIIGIWMWLSEPPNIVLGVLVFVVFFAELSQVAAY